MKGSNSRIKVIKRKGLRLRMQRRSNLKIFSVVKELRSTNHHSDFSTSQSELSEESLLSLSSSSLSDIEIPSFFNDFMPSLELQTKLQQYDKLNYMFDNIEDRDMYLVRKDSLFC